MGNKRVSELAPITVPELASNDLFVIADVSEVESKKLELTNLKDYFQSNITSSATASYALNSLTASHLLYQGFYNGTASYALTSSLTHTASHALIAHTASHGITAHSSSYSLTASYSITASYAETSSVYLVYSSAYSEYAKSASFLIYGGVDNGTASYSLISNLAYSANTASYLLYSGFPNGTASYALHSATSATASFLLYNGKPNGTASHALISNIAIGSLTSSYLQYNELTSNGTASFAISSSKTVTSSYSFFGHTSSYSLTASYIENVYKVFGPFTPTLSTPTTAALAISITSSVSYPIVVFEIGGDCGIPLRNNPSSNGVISVEGTSTALPLTTVTVLNTWAHAPTNVVGGTDLTGSITSSFFAKKTNSSLLSNVKWDLAFNATNCNFQNGYNPLTVWVLSQEVTDINQN